MNNRTPQFSVAWGDRVDHRIFGLGTVSGEPVGPYSGASVERDGGGSWKVEVNWDDPERGSFGVMDYALRLVDRPDAKGGAYWSAEYQKLKAGTQSLRKKTDQAVQKAFRRRDGKGAAGLLTLLETERAALVEMIAFLEADERGEHP